MDNGSAAMATASPSPRANYEKLAAERTAKIQRYKQQKEFEKKLKVCMWVYVCLIVWSKGESLPL